MSKVKTENRVRFAWWGAEEAGLVGSTYYVNDLRRQRRRPGWTPSRSTSTSTWSARRTTGCSATTATGRTSAWSAPTGPDEIEATFARYYSERGIPSEAVGLQRTVRLPGVHHQRHPVGWPVHRRRRHQDRRAGGQVGRDRRRRRTTRATTRPATRSTTSARRHCGSTPTPSRTRSTCTHRAGEVLNDREARKHGRRSAGPFA